MLTTDANFLNMMIKYLYIVETFLTNDKIRLILYVFWWLASSEVLWGVGIISSQVFGKNLIHFLLILHCNFSLFYIFLFI